MRLWASGTVFRTIPPMVVSALRKTFRAALNCSASVAARRDGLLSLLMASVRPTGLQASRPRLLLGHAALMDLVLRPFSGALRDQIRTALIDFDRLAIEGFDLADAEEDQAALLVGLPWHPDGY